MTSEFDYLTEKERLLFIAGLLEGEGCFSAKGNGTDRNIVVQCHMTDLDVLKSLQKCLGGIGSIGGPYKNGQKDHYKDRYHYRINGSAAYEVMKKLLPYLGERRSRRIQELLDGFDAVPVKIYRMQNITTREIETTTNLGGWLRDHGISGTGLWRTLSGERNACKGWKRLADG